MHYQNRDMGINYIKARKDHRCYGMGLGIIILDDVYPGFPGDVRNASAFPFPIQYEIAGGVDIWALVHEDDKSPCREPILGARDMNPPPPDLSEAAGSRSPSEGFWVIKNGIRMTGMPAWGSTHSDAQLWELVAFIERLPALTGDGYRQLAESEGGDGHGHEHGESARTDPERQQHREHSH